MHAQQHLFFLQKSVALTVTSIISLFFCNHRISILDNGSLRIWNVTKSDAGLYTCVARNQFGVASSTGSIIVKGISCSAFTIHHFCFCRFFHPILVTSVVIERKGLFSNNTMPIMRYVDSWLTAWIVKGNMSSVPVLIFVDYTRSFCQPGTFIFCAVFSVLLSFWLIMSKPLNHSKLPG